MALDPQLIPSALLCEEYLLTVHHAANIDVLDTYSSLSLVCDTYRQYFVFMPEDTQRDTIANLARAYCRALFGALERPLVEVELAFRSYEFALFARGLREGIRSENTAFN